MYKWWLIFGGALCLYIAYLSVKLESSQNKIALLEAQKNSLTGALASTQREVEVFNEKSMAASQQIVALKEAAMASDNDCYTRPIDDNILNILRKQSTSATTK